jgi:DNA ligase-1
MMNFIRPMLLDSRTDPFDSNDYIFEPKSNGIRLELIAVDTGVKLITRHGNDVTISLPEIASLNIEDGVVLDSELVCYDLHNPLKEDFEAVMGRIMSKREMSISAAVKRGFLKSGNIMTPVFVDFI